jgi:hypothetical protein
MRKLLAICFAILLACAPLEATTYILVRVGTKLYIGGDGYRVDYATGTPTPHCKFAQNDKVITLTWGLATGGTTSHVEPFADLVAPISASQETIFEKRERLIPLAHQFLIRQMDLRDSQSKEPVTDKVKANFGIGAAFISMEHGNPEVGAFKLTIVDWSKRNIIPDRFPDWNWDVPVFFGNSQAYSEVIYAGMDPAILKTAQADPVMFIRKVLERQHELTPKDVGPPYSIAIFSASGLEWIEKGACSHI